MSKIFEVKNLKKYYKEVKALDDITLSAEAGTIYGLLGPNGAGKTTLIRLLSTLIPATSGEAKVLNLDVKKDAQKVRETIGLAGQYAAVDEYLTGMENLYMVGRLYHLNHKEAKANSQKILKRLSLSDAADRQVGTYSGGMRRRLDLGACLVGRPKILFLDEPTTGLDPRTRLELWDLIEELVKEGTSIVLTTQYLEEADRLANKMAVIDKGKVIAEGTSNQLKDEIGKEVVELEVNSNKEVEKTTKLLESINLAAKPTDAKFGLSIPAKNGSQSLMQVVEILSNAKITPKTISLHKPSLDDVFLTLTGKTAHQEEANQEADV